MHDEILSLQAQSTQERGSRAGDGVSNLRCGGIGENVANISDREVQKDRVGEREYEDEAGDLCEVHERYGCNYRVRINRIWRKVGKEPD